MTRRSLGKENTGGKGAKNIGPDKRSGFSEHYLSLSRHRQASEDCPGVLALQRHSKTLEEPVGLCSGSVARPGRQQAPESEVKDSITNSDVMIRLIWGPKARGWGCKSPAFISTAQI